MKAKRHVRLEMAEWKSAWKPRNVHVSIRKTTILHCPDSYRLLCGLVSLTIKVYSSSMHSFSKQKKSLFPCSDHTTGTLRIFLLWPIGMHIISIFSTYYTKINVQEMIYIQLYFYYLVINLFIYFLLFLLSVLLPSLFLPSCD